MLAHAQNTECIRINEHQDGTYTSLCTLPDGSGILTWYTSDGFSEERVTDPKRWGERRHELIVDYTARLKAETEREERHLKESEAMEEARKEAQREADQARENEQQDADQERYAEFEKRQKQDEVAKGIHRKSDCITAGFLWLNGWKECTVPASPSDHARSIENRKDCNASGFVWDDVLCRVAENSIELIRDKKQCIASGHKWSFGICN